MGEKYSNKYDDIINLPHHVSKKYPQMSIEARSAQFAPYAALTGYSDVIKETGRITNEKIELDEEIKKIIDIKLHKIKETIKKTPYVFIQYFVEDKRKQGGEYVSIQGNVKKIDEYSQKIVFEEGTEVAIDDILEIEILEKINR